MLMCDFCAQFYHPGCVGLTVTESEILQRYKCPKCIDDGNDELLYDERISILTTK